MCRNISQKNLSDYESWLWRIWRKEELFWLYSKIKVNWGGRDPDWRFEAKKGGKGDAKPLVIGPLSLQGCHSNIFQSLRTCENSRDVYLGPKVRLAIRQCYTKSENPPRFHRRVCSCNQVCSDETQKLVIIRNRPTILRNTTQSKEYIGLTTGPFSLPGRCWGLPGSILGSLRGDEAVLLRI